MFKPVKKVAPAPAVEGRALPNVREPVILKLDSDVRAYFQTDRPDWQERINDALGATMTDDH